MAECISIPAVFWLGLVTALLTAVIAFPLGYLLHRKQVRDQLGASGAFYFEGQPLYPQRDERGGHVRVKEFDR